MRYPELTQTPKKFVPKLSEEMAMKRAKLLRAIADPTRLRMLELLCEYGGQMTVSDMVETIDTLSQPTLSHHNRLLADAGLIRCHKSGLFGYYSVVREELERAQKIVNDLLLVLAEYQSSYEAIPRR